MSYTSTGRKRAPRKRTRYSGRSYGTSAARPKERGPSKGQEQAEEALRSVLDLFENPDRLPKAIAQTVIANAENAFPSAAWSLGNQLVVLLNGGTGAAGFKQWKELGRTVKKGSKAVYILGPVVRKIRDNNPTTGEEEDRTFVAGFRGIPVFRFEDTEGADISIPSYEPPQFPPLFEVAEKLGVTVRYAPFVGRFRGFYSPGREEILLCTDDARTFFHELAHAAHARARRAKGSDLKGGQNPGQEIVAETVAAVLCKLYDFQGYLAHSRDYVAAYAGAKSPGAAAMRMLGEIQETLQVIFDAADSTTDAAGSPDPVAAPVAA